MRFTYQVILAVFIGVILAPVLANIRWAAIPGAVSAIHSQWSAADPAPKTAAPALEGTSDETREELKRRVLAAGRAALANPCAAEARTAYRDMLLHLAQRRFDDSGCSSLFSCVRAGRDNLPHLREVARLHYTSVEDRQISEQILRASKAGAIRSGAIGLHAAFVGHPDQSAEVMAALTGPDLLLNGERLAGGPRCTRSGDS